MDVAEESSADSPPPYERDNDHNSYSPYRPSRWPRSPLHYLPPDELIREVGKVLDKWYHWFSQWRNNGGFFLLTKDRGFDLARGGDFYEDAMRRIYLRQAESTGPTLETSCLLVLLWSFRACFKMWLVHGAVDGNGQELPSNSLKVPDPEAAAALHKQLLHGLPDPPGYQITTTRPEPETIRYRTVTVSQFWCGITQLRPMPLMDGPWRNESGLEDFMVTVCFRLHGTIY